MSLEELQAKMSTAIAKNDVTTIEAIAAEIVASKKDRAKAEVLKLQAEAEKMAGAREALAAKYEQPMRKTFASVCFNPDTKTDSTNKELEAVKAIGYHFRYYKDAAGVWTISSGLDTVAIKVPKVGGTTGKRGGLQEDFDNVVDQYSKANSVDVMAELAAALEKDKTVTNQGYSYNVKKKVQKWGIAQGLIQPTK